MTSLITGTWSLISSSAEVITGARRMTLRIHRLLQPGHLELNEADRRRLLALQKRVECLVQPLNFLLLWSKKRDSCVQQVVLSAQELLFDVCAFVERFVPSDGSTPSAVGKGAGGGGGIIDSEQLEHYLRELEFTCTSVSMAVSIARVSEAMPLPQPAKVSNGCSSSSSGGVSLSAVLRASKRIQEMLGRSGDLCAYSGRLYMQAAAARDPALLEAGGAGGSSGSTAVCNDDMGGKKNLWSPVLSLATFKVVSAVDARFRRRRYGITVESRLPLSQRSGQQPDVVGEDSQKEGLNASGPLSFSIDVALDANLVSTAHVSLPSEPVRCPRDLGVDSLVLVWSAEEAGADDDENEEFPDAVIIPEASRDSGAPRPFGPPTLQKSGAFVKSASVCSYAFIFDGPRGVGEPRTGEAEVALSPLDALYLARLCALDDGHHQPFADGSSADGVNSACPPHLLASDEVLAALLPDIGCIGASETRCCANGDGMEEMGAGPGRRGGGLAGLSPAAADCGYPAASGGALPEFAGLS